jgi:hypothetical protein
MYCWPSLKPENIVLAVRTIVDYFRKRSPANRDTTPPDDKKD